jgi:uncharacterized protein
LAGTVAEDRNELTAYEVRVGQPEGSEERKHKISFAEAISAFQDAQSVTYPDLDHSEEEDRFLIIGAATTGSVVVVSHAFHDETIRIISARMTTTKERSFYEKQSSC